MATYFMLDYANLLFAFNLGPLRKVAGPGVLNRHAH